MTGPEDARRDTAGTEHSVPGQVAGAEQTPGSAIESRAGIPDLNTPEEIRAYAVEEARKGIERGWAFTPLDGKMPRNKTWQKAPAASLKLVEKYINQGNIGLRTGSVSGVIVLDDDSEDGSNAVMLDLPTTVTVITGSGKSHYYYRAPSEKLGNGTGNLPDGLDVRGTGGQAVFVGSTHPGTGGVYRWAPGRSPEEIEMADLPASVLDLIRAPKRKAKAKSKGSTRGSEKKRRPVAIDDSASKVLDGAARDVSSAAEGSRNKTLNREAFRMGRWINAGLVSRADVERALGDAARAAGLEDSEIGATLRSALNAGCSQPFRYHGSVDPRTPCRPKPSITLEGGKLPELVTAAEDALISAEVPLFQRGGMIVRTMRAPAMTMREVYRRAEGVLMLHQVDSTHLVEILTTVANWYRYVREDLALSDCPERIARTYLARTGQWRIRRLLGVIETPTLRPDGSILDEPGYDDQTSLWFDPGAVKFPSIPDEPTRDDALAGLAALNEVIKDFPWVEDCDRAAALAAILTAMIRHSLRTAPLTAFRAPKMGSGKSLLADVVAMIATGRICSVMSQGKDEDEDKKRMLAILVEGISVACIDNIERPFGGAALCSILTQELWRERILGKTGTATVPTATTWIATGNNIQFVGDIVTRVVPCDLDANVERPEERDFDIDLHKYIPEHRGDLVVAGLTVLRAYRVAGSPAQGLPIFGRFEEWSGWVRSALVWLGLPDPCAGRDRLYSQDPVGNQLRQVLRAWKCELGHVAYSVSDVLNKVRPKDGSVCGPLYEAITVVAAGKDGEPDRRRFGHYLSKYERRAEGGLRIERVGERQGVVLWRVAPLHPATSGGHGDKSVGSEGSVGSSEPVADEDSPGAGGDERLDDSAASREGDGSGHGPAKKNPPNPQNPRPAGAPGARGREQPSQAGAGPEDLIV